MRTCKYACSCGGICGGCPYYKPEAYVGEAEDYRAQQLGYKNYDHYLQSQKSLKSNNTYQRYYTKPDLEVHAKKGEKNNG